MERLKDHALTFGVDSRPGILDLYLHESSLEPPGRAIHRLGRDPQGAFFDVVHRILDQLPDGAPELLRVDFDAGKVLGKFKIQRDWAAFREDLVSGLVDDRVHIAELQMKLSRADEVAEILEYLFDPQHVRRQALLEGLQLLAVQLSLSEKMSQFVGIALDREDAVTDHVAALRAELAPGYHSFRADDLLQAADVIQANRKLLGNRL